MSNGRPYRRQPYPQRNYRAHTQEQPYFVPAFGIRRNVAPDDELVNPLFRALRKKLGRYYSPVPPKKIHLATLEKTKFIERMRDARERPDADVIRDLALTIRDGLSNTIANDPPGLVLPLGKVERFGTEQNLLGIVPLGWRGYGKRYARRSDEGGPLALGTIVAEHQLALGGITTAMSTNPRFIIDGLAQTPHILIAKHNGRIRDDDLWRAQDRVDEIYGELRATDVEVALRLDDPMIYLNARVGQPAELIRVRNPPLVAVQIQPVA